MLQSDISVNNPYLLLLHISLASFLWVIGKQCITRPDATDHSVSSGSPLFAYICSIRIQIKMKNTTQQSLKRKWTCPFDKGWKFHAA